MFKFLAAAFLLAMPLAFTSCVVDGHSGLPEPIYTALAFTVENRMDAPVTVNIRKHYIWEFDGNNFATYGEWISLPLGSLETRSLANDAEGNFMLINPALRNVAGMFVASFEITVETPKGAMRFAGYETEDPRFEAVGLCYIRAWYMADAGGGSVMLYTREQVVSFRIDYILPTQLIVNEDGTVSFLAERVTDSGDTQVLGRFDADVETVRRMY